MHPHVVRQMRLAGYADARRDHHVDQHRLTAPPAEDAAIQGLALGLVQSPLVGHNGRRIDEGAGKIGGLVRHSGAFGTSSALIGQT